MSLDIFQYIHYFDGPFVGALFLLFYKIKPENLINLIEIGARKKLAESILQAKIKHELALNKQIIEFQEIQEQLQRDFEEEQSSRADSEKLIRLEFYNNAKIEIENMRNENRYLIHREAHDQQEEFNKLHAKLDREEQLSKERLDILLQEKTHSFVHQLAENIFDNEANQQKYLEFLRQTLDKEKQAILIEIKHNKDIAIHKIIRNSTFQHELMVKFWESTSKCFDASYHLKQVIKRTFEMDQIDRTSLTELMNGDWKVVYNESVLQLRIHRQHIYECKPFFDDDNSGNIASEIGNNSAEMIRSYKRWSNIDALPHQDFCSTSVEEKINVCFDELTDKNKELIKNLSQQINKHYSNLYELPQTERLY